MRDFRKLAVWGEAHSLALATYNMTSTFPRNEVNGLTSQIRRAAASIPSSIAEGCGRSEEGEFARFLQIALGSTSQLEYLLLLARDLGFLPDSDYAEISDRANHVKRMLISFIARLGEAPGKS